MAAEVDRLITEMGLTRRKARQSVTWISRDKGDSLGFDIQSLNSDGSPRYIEVKATQGKPGDMSFFYTINELRTAEQYGKDYYLYIVYDILSTKPQIWVVQNPFIKQDLRLQPIKFKVNVKVK